MIKRRLDMGVGGSSNLTTPASFFSTFPLLV